MLVFI